MPKKILVVDDEKEIVRLLATRLKSNNYQVFEAFDGKQALQIAHKEVPDLIITDVMMPEGDGFDIIEELKTSELTSKIPFIIITAFPREDVLKKALEVGMENFFEKPFNCQQIVDRAKVVLGE